MTDPIRTRILAHGRSGTVYMAKVLRACGLDYGHERDGAHGAVGGIFFKGRQVLSSYPQIWLQVRHPLRVISSSTTSKPANFRKLFDVIGVACEERDPLKRAMFSWLAYDAWAQRLASFTFPIERLPDLWPTICRKLQIAPKPLPDISRQTNSRVHEEYTWDDLWHRDRAMASRVYMRAIEYGYA